jgi:hypothetical protein
MKTVKFAQSIHIESLGTTYRKGDEVELPDEIADRHIESGFATIPKGKVDLTKDKEVTVKK